MERLNFLVIGKNQEILDTLKRILEKNEGWHAELTSNENYCYKFLEENPVDILLLSSGLDEQFEVKVKEFAASLGKGIKIIDHYGGGSGLLKNEVYSLFPKWNS